MDSNKKETRSWSLLIHNNEKRSFVFPQSSFFCGFLEIPPSLSFFFFSFIFLFLFLFPFPFFSLALSAQLKIMNKSFERKQKRDFLGKKNSLLKSTPHTTQKKIFKKFIKFFYLCFFHLFFLFFLFFFKIKYQFFFHFFFSSSIFSDLILQTQRYFFHLPLRTMRTDFTSTTTASIIKKFEITNCCLLLFDSLR